MADSVRGPGRVVERDGKRSLYGGKDPGQDFDVTEFRLDPRRLKYGLGREAFPALIKPQFVTARQANRWLSDQAPVLGVSIGAEAKAYPLALLVRHEVVNDVVGGSPIFAAYCILADLGAIYKRWLGGHIYTFAVSGYTYSEPTIWDGLQAFVLWDRDTESLWLPTIGKAVSGPMIDVPLQLAPPEEWEQMPRFTRWERYTGPFPEKARKISAETLPTGE